MIKKILYQPFLIRLLNWEYWPFHIVYGPIYIYWLWLCIRARSLFFFNTSNPSIKNGGFLMESKWDIYKILPEGYFPSTIYFEAGASEDEILNKVLSKELKFPLIGKPDIGMKGMSVKKIE